MPRTSAPVWSVMALISIATSLTPAATPVT
jgi:hypothetical protein